MVSTGETLFMLFKVVFAFVLLFIFIPSRIIRFDKASEGFLDKVFISLTYATFITVVLVHLLVYLRIFETISLVLCYILICYVMLKYRGIPSSGTSYKLENKPVVFLLEIADDKEGTLNAIRQRIKKWLSRFKSHCFKTSIDMIKQPFSGIFVIPVIVGAAYIRFHHSLTHLYFGASDAYEHLIWAKLLGNNAMYYDGAAYPRGFHSVISALNKIFFMDPYYIVRFLGPLTGCLIVLSIYYGVLKSFKNQHMAFAAALLYISSIGLPTYVWRQISSMPEEFATIFFIPGIYFFNTYLTEKANKYLLLSCECLALSLLIHPYAAVFVCVGYGISALVHIKTLFNPRFLLKAVFSYLAAVLIGLSPIIIAALSGIKIITTYITESVKTPGSGLDLSKLLKFSEPNHILTAVLLCCTTALVVTMLMLILKKEYTLSLNAATSILYACLALVLYVLYKGTSLGIPTIMDPSRIGIFFSITAAIALSIGLYILGIIFRSEKAKSMVVSTVCIGLVISILAFTRFEIPVGDQMEYDEAVEAYLNIKNSYPALDWTIVSPVEQYQEIINYGYHYNLWQFVSVLSEPKDNKLEFTTDYVFIFVEKYPVYSQDRMISEADAKAAFPKVTGTDLTEYYKGNNRRILEAKTYYWAENYMKSHKNMEVFFDDKNMRIYKIEQDGNHPVDLLK